MKNITVSLPDDVYRRVRVKAAQNDTSVSAVVRNYLEKYVEGERAASSLVDAVDQIRAELEAEGKQFSADNRLTREELYEEAFRGHERSSVQRKHPGGQQAEDANRAKDSR